MLHMLYIVTISVLNHVNPSYAVVCCTGFYHCPKNATKLELGSMCSMGSCQRKAPFWIKTK